MNVSSLTEVISLGGYGLYVWGSYAVTLALMLLEPWLVRRHRSRALCAVTAAPHETET